VGVQHSATKDAYLISFRRYKRDYTCILYRLADIEDIEYSEGTRVHPLGYRPLSYANQVINSIYSLIQEMQAMETEKESTFDTKQEIDHE